MTSTQNCQPTTFDSQQLVEIMHEMIRCSDTDQLLELLLDGVWKLMCGDNYCYGWVGRLDRSTGEIIFVKSTEELDLPWCKTNYGKGITGRALQSQTIQNVADVRQDRDYIPQWNRTKSEIVIPILVEKVRAIENFPEEKQTPEQKTTTVLCSKPLGVLNFESNKTNVFKPELEKSLLLLCSHAGGILDKIDRAAKLESLYEIEKEIQNQEKTPQIVINYDNIMNGLVRETAKKLEFDIVNISLVDRIRQNIDSMYVYSADWTDKKTNEFKTQAKHSLDSNDIQAHIVRHGKPEVPPCGDKRFDENIYQTFEHGKLRRIFLPIVDPSSNLVVATLEAGYQHSFNQHIYETDLYLLTRVVDLFLKAMERKRAILINKAIHDLRSPVSHIRSNASFLNRRIDNLDKKIIQKKAMDVFNDSESLIYNIAQLEYALTSKLTRLPQSRTVNIYTEIIVNSIKAKKGVVEAKGFNLYWEIPEELHGITIKTDISKLNQVIHNLFDNAIKYCDRRDPDSFEITISMEESKKGDFIEIYFYDRGIGISEKYREDIFQLGFRDPKIINSVLGSGLGLTISRDLMHELGGNLELTGCKDPTTFKLTIPKNNN